MLPLIILSCLATAYTAGLGYEYDKPPSGNNGVDRVPSRGFIPNQSFQAGPSYGNDYAAQPSSPTAYMKEFFSFSAPEGEFDNNGDNHQSNIDLKPGLRVIFIKGPEDSGLENAALQLAKSAVEQHTVIYVLKKQTDIEDFANKLNALNKNNDNKPEVHFVKYRTPDDAINAQRTIQDQYEGLGGESSNHDGVVAPVLNFASKAPLNINSAPAEPLNAYLPVI